MAKGKSLKAALLSHQDRETAKAARAKAEEFHKQKEQSLRNGGKKKGGAAQKRLDKQSAEVAQAPAPTASRRRPIYPLDPSDTVLLIGEGNFSYALSLLLPPHSHPGHQLLATAYDTEEECYSKYPDAEQIVGRIRGFGARVEFGVDAGALEKCKAVGKGRQWSKVVFNFPHAGAGIKDQDRNIITNQYLLLSFFRSAASLLTEGPPRVPVVARGKPRHQQKKRSRGGDSEDEAPVTADIDMGAGEGDESEADDIGIDVQAYLAQNSTVAAVPDTPQIPASPVPTTFTPPKVQGTLLITLKDSKPYTEWDVRSLAVRPPRSLSAHPAFVALNRNHVDVPQPRYTLLRSFEFVPDLYEGYEHRRTIGWREGLSKAGNEELLKLKKEGKGRDRGLGGLRTWEFALKNIAEE